MSYGQELILDIHDCWTLFTEENIRIFMQQLCELLDMEAADLHLWGYDTQEELEEAPEHLAGTSAIQFITTSNITLHCLDKLCHVYINIFTCGTLDVDKAKEFCSTFWNGDIAHYEAFRRV